jgi:hypothetical protein
MPGMTTKDTIRRQLLRVHPADCTVLALLALATLIAAMRLPAVGPELTDALVLHAVLLAGFVLAAAAMARWEQAPLIRFARPGLIVSIIFILYTSLGQLGVAAMPYGADGTLSRMDTCLFGVDPSLFIQRYQTPGWVEFFSFIYGAFIPYIYLSLILGCLGRPPVERDQFLTGWVFTYALSYLGYLFVPAHGPVVYHAADYTVDLGQNGGVFYDFVMRGVVLSGGLQGVFPSLHVGGSVYLCLFDLQTNRLRGLTYLPMVLLIYLSTLFLRYHYVVDLIAGTVVAATCIPLGRKAFMHWAERRERAGLPALPGGEGDDLPGLSGAGPADAPPLFSAN